MGEDQEGVWTISFLIFPPKFTMKYCNKILTHCLVYRKQIKAKKQKQVLGQNLQ